MVSQISAIIAATAGAQVDVQDLPTARARFDDWLNSPLDSAGGGLRDPHQRELEAALGVA